LNFDIVLEAQEIYDRLSKFNPVQLENIVNSILNKLRNDYNCGRRTFIIDKIYKKRKKRFNIMHQHTINR